MRPLRSLAFALAATAALATGAWGGSFVYLHDYATDQIHGFSLAKKGLLAEIPGSPFAGPGGTGSCDGQCQTLTYSKKRKALYAATPVGISAWIVEKSGVLTPVPGSPFGSGDFTGIAAVQRGKRVFVYVADTTNDQIQGFEAAKDGTLTALPDSPWTGLPFPVGMAAVKNKLFAALQGDVDEMGMVLVESKVASFLVGKDGSLTPGPGSPYSLDQSRFLYNVSPEPKGKVLYVADDGTKLHSLLVDKKTAGLTQAPGSPFGSDLDIAANGASAGKKFVYLLDFQAGATGDDLVGYDANVKTGVPDDIVGVTSTGIDVDVHGLDAKGKTFVAASTLGASVRTFRVLGPKDSFFPEPADAAPLTSPTLLTGIAVIKR